MDDTLPVCIDPEHILAGAVYKLSALIVGCLFISDGPEKVELLGEVHASRDDRTGLVVEVEYLNHALVDLLLDTGEVVLEPTNKQTCLLQSVCLSRCIRGLAHRVWFSRH